MLTSPTPPCAQSHPWISESLSLRAWASHSGKGWAWSSSKILIQQAASSACVNLLKFIHLFIPSMTTYGVPSTARPPSMCGDISSALLDGPVLKKPRAYKPCGVVKKKKKEETAAAPQRNHASTHGFSHPLRHFLWLPSPSVPIGVWAAPSRACGSFIKSQGLINSLWELYAYQMSQWMN